jgi:hypothetical protein
MAKIDDTVFEYQEFAIGGKLVTATMKVTEFETIGVSSDELKERLMRPMIDYIIENRLAEFTMVDSPVDNCKTYRVRCYLAPDATVKILRTLKQNQLQL